MFFGGRTMDKDTVYVPTFSELLSAKEYQKELLTNRENIEEVKFIPPKIGKQGFGSFKVSYRTAVLRKCSWTR